MKKGYLSEFFDGVAAKVLRDVEADGFKSHQHEFNGVKGLKHILGEPSGSVKYPTKFLFLTDGETDPLVDEDFLTWYDAREKARVERNVNRTEYRLYFPTNLITQSLNTGDILVIAKTKENSLLAIVAEKDSTIATQLLWLFGFSDLTHPGFSIREELETEQDRIQFTSRFILESIGIEIQTEEENYLDDMLNRFDGDFPTTRDFSEYSRSTLRDIDINGSQDDVLLAWLEREEILFRTLEKHIVLDRLAEGFKDDVDGFFAFSLSVQNRRKSRAGFALENHLEHIFTNKNLSFSRTEKTENKSKPDFLFPGINEYRNTGFNTELLTMLGVKYSCKDRWRQILSEAKRIERKHLLTLESPISINQTEEMRNNQVTLVIPSQLHEPFSNKQKEIILSLDSFIEMVSDKQSKGKT